MRPPTSPLTSKHRYADLIVALGLFSGILITAAIWLRVPNQFIHPLFWLSLGFIGLGSFLYLRRLADPRPRWIMVLAAFAAVSLVYLFPEMFGPACGGMPRAFALNCPRECQVTECTKWVAGPSPECPNPGSGGGCCLTYETTCDRNCFPNTPPDQPPSVSEILICSKWGLNGWCIGSLSLQLTANEPQGKQLQISGDIAGTPFTCLAGAGSTSCSIPLPQGSGTANYVATSITGLTDSGSSSYKHDSTLPLINGLLNGASGDNGWFISAVDVTASASDPGPGSGLSALLYNLDAAGWTSYPGPLSLSDGVHSLSLRATDIAGNSVDLDQNVKVDTITPTLDLSVIGTAGSNNWFRSNLQVSAVASDSGSDVSVFEFDLDGAGWASYTAPLELSDGIHNVSLRVVDTAGNNTTWSQNFQVDTLTPVLELNVNGSLRASGWYTISPQVNLSASDPDTPLSGSSGLSALEYNLDDVGWIPYSAPLQLRDGLHNLELRAVDIAGNISSGAQSFQVDTLAPTLDVNVSGTSGASSWYVTPVQVEAVAADSTSSLSILEVKVDGGAWGAYNVPLALGDGPHSYRFRATDNAGNLTITALQSLQVDTIPPTISLPKSWELGEIAEFALQDSGSGLASVRLVIEDEDERYPKVTWEKALSSYNFEGDINWDGRFKDNSLALPGGEYYATLKVTDNAGNESRMTGQVKVPLSEYVDSLIDSVGGLVNGIQETDPVVELVPNPDPDEALPSPYEEGMPSTLTFGGGSNNTDPSSEQTGVNLGGRNNGAAQPSGAQTGIKSFSEGGQSTLPIGNDPSDILWGATATAAIGAFAAEILRKKEEQEEARQAAIVRRNQKNKQLAAAYQASLDNFKAVLNNALAMGMSETVASGLKETVLKTGKFGASLGATVNFISDRMAEINARKQAAVIAHANWKEQQIEAQTHVYEAPAASAYSAPDMSWKKGDYAQLDHAEEVAEQAKIAELKDEENWWSKAKVFVQGQIIQPVDSFIVQPMIEPALEMINETVTNTSTWLNEKVYAPHIKPKIENAKNNISSNIAWVNENIYQPYVQPAIEESVQKAQECIAWVNENIYQPYAKPAIEKTIDVFNKSIAWTSENIYQPYIQPLIEKTIKAVNDGVAWTNEKIYQPFLRPLLTSINEKVYQPYVLPLLEKTKATTSSLASWVDQNIYQPYLQPVVSDINKYIYQPLIKPVEEKTTAWWQDTWEQYGEWVHSALDTVGFIPAIGDLADGINGLIYLTEGRYLEAAISAVAMIPLIGDLGKGGKWGLKIGSEVIEETVEKVVKESVEELTQEALEVVTERAVKEVGEEIVEKAAQEAVEEFTEKALKETSEELIEKGVKESLEEIEEKILEETGSEVLEKTAKETYEAVAEKVIKETGKDLIENVSHEILEKSSKELKEKVVVTVAKEEAETIATTSTKKVSKIAAEEALEETAEQVAQETAQFIESLRKTYGDEMVDRFLPFCEKYGIDPQEILTRPPAEGQSLIGWGLGIDNPANPVNHPLVKLNLTEEEINQILEKSLKNPDSKIVSLGYGGGVKKPYYMLGDEIDGCYISISAEDWAPFDTARANFWADLNMPFIESAIEQRKMFIFNIDRKVIMDPMNAGRFSLPELKLIELPGNNYVRVELNNYDLMIPKELEESYLEYLPSNLLGELK